MQAVPAAALQRHVSTGMSCVCCPQHYDHCVGGLHRVSCQPFVPLLLQSQIQKKMTTEMVEPKRKYVDIEAVWKKQRLKKKAGPGGLLSVTLVQARDLRSALGSSMTA